MPNTIHDNPSTSHPHRWLAEMLVALVAGACLLLYFQPLPHDDLVSVEGHEPYDGNPWYKERGIFPLSFLFIDRGYREVTFYLEPTTFLVDIPFPNNYRSGDPLRLWIRDCDRQRMLDNPNVSVRVYALEVFDPSTGRWTRYVPLHPRGNGNFLGLGILLIILLAVMTVSNLCFVPRDPAR